MLTFIELIKKTAVLSAYFDKILIRLICLNLSICKGIQSFLLCTERPRVPSDNLLIFTRQGFSSFRNFFVFPNSQDSPASREAGLFIPSSLVFRIRGQS